MPTFEASGSHHAPMPELDPPRGEVVEGRERRGEQPDVARPVVDHARADPDPLGDGGEGGHRDRRLADEPALGLPDGFEAGGLGELRVPHPVADRMLVLQVERYAIVSGDGHRRPPFGSNSCGPISSRRAQRRSRLPRGLGGELPLVDPSEPPVEHDPLAGDHHVADVARRQPEDPVAGEGRGVQRGRCRVVEDDEVGGSAGLERAEQRLAEEPAGEPRPFGQPRERPVDPGRQIVLAEPEVRRPRLLEHVGADPVGAERDALSHPPDRGAANRVVHVRARVVSDRGAGFPDECELVGVQVDAVGEERALVERTGGGQAGDHA